MRWKDLAMSLTSFWREYMRYKTGLLGLSLLILFVLVAVFAPFLTPTEAFARWSDITYWEDYPKGVPPEWVNLLSREKSVTQYVDEKPALISAKIGDIQKHNITFRYKYQDDIPPSDILLKISAIVANPTEKPGAFFVHVLRPDGRALNKVTSVEKYTGEETGRILFRLDETVRTRMIDFASEYETEENMEKIREKEEFVNPLLIMFSMAEPGIILGRSPPLKGEYKIVTQLYLTGKNDTFTGARIVFKGSVFGILGTDALGRDLFVGIAWGSRFALIIGLVTALLSESLGVLYGVASAYMGGTTDELLQRIQEIVFSLPFLPILIILAYIMRPTIWTLALLMTIFNWVGPVKTVRSMALQFKEQPYIEASKAIGCSGWRIVFRHILPQILPYYFALIALSVPGAILTEAGISFLMGAVGVSEPTWGRILHDAQRYSATINGMWWWVLIPGVLISVAGLTFVLIGSALDRILNPTLRR